jgi:BirA family biotin operon repressor/biotin-[acetyl-CoA-carboxylase] ligase
MVDAIERARPRLGRLASLLQFYETVGSTNDIALAHLAVGSLATIAEPLAPSTERLASSTRPRDPGSQVARPSTQLPAPSTQREAAGNQRLVPSEGLVVVADEQTSGRGRRGHTWFSPAGSGLYVSVVLTPGASVDKRRATLLLTLAAGVALAEGIVQSTGLRVDLKWPNDLLVGRRKVGGILAESSGGGSVGIVVVGYGLNVRVTDLPAELRDRVTSLESELGRAVDRHQLLAETLAGLSRRYEDLLAGRFDAILDAWRGLAPRAIGARVEWTTNAGTASGITAGIDDRGALLVRVDDRVERIVSGEVMWL